MEWWIIVTVGAVTGLVISWRAYHVGRRNAERDNERELERQYDWILRMAKALRDAGVREIPAPTSTRCNFCGEQVAGKWGSVAGLDGTVICSECVVGHADEIGDGEDVETCRRHVSRPRIVPPGL